MTDRVPLEVEERLGDGEVEPDPLKVAVTQPLEVIEELTLREPVRE